MEAHYDDRDDDDLRAIEAGRRARQQWHQEHRLNQEQFGPHLPGREQNPHQLALPGMEKMAHPWAEHLARGYTLQYGASQSQHHLEAWNTDNPHWPEKVATLDWQKRRGPHGPAAHPGEIAMVENYAAGTPRGRGLAGALMRSAHHFNFGQDTVPIHSPTRSFEGEEFASKTMPELKPDVWNNYINNERTTAPGKPFGEAAKWPDMPANIHPFQKVEQAQVDERRTRVSNKMKQAQSGQGTLF